MHRRDMPDLALVPLNVIGIGGHYADSQVINTGAHAHQL